MNNILKKIKELYNPSSIIRNNNAYVLDNGQAKWVVKFNNKIDYNKLYDYLYSRGFNYLPDIVYSDDKMIVFEYRENIDFDKDQRLDDLIRIVALLHSKTSYFKSVTLDNYKDIYNVIDNNLNYVDNLYNGYFDTFIKEDVIRPSYFLLLCNSSLIFKAISYARYRLDEWFNIVKNKNKERISLIHNNLSLDHFIKNSDDYLVGWDNYSYDSPVLDLYNLYLEEWNTTLFSKILDSYNNIFELLPEERILFDILISIPFVISFCNSEIDNCIWVRRLIEYLKKSSSVIEPI